MDLTLPKPTIQGGSCPKLLDQNKVAEVISLTNKNEKRLPLALTRNERENSAASTSASMSVEEKLAKAANDLRIGNVSL